MKQKIYLGMSLFTIALIWYNSSLIGTTSSAISISLSTRILETFYQFVSIFPFTFDQFHAFIRKLGHVSEYAFLAFLLYQTCQRHKGLLSFGCCVGVASMDEWIQTQTIGRNGNIYDVFLDSIAAFVMIALMIQFYEHKKKTRITSNL